MRFWNLLLTFLTLWTVSACKKSTGPRSEFRTTPLYFSDPYYNAISRDRSLVFADSAGNRIFFSVTPSYQNEKGNCDYQTGTDGMCPQSFTSDYKIAGSILFYRMVYPDSIVDVADTTTGAYYFHESNLTNPTTSEFIWNGRIRKDLLKNQIQSYYGDSVTEYFEINNGVKIQTLDCRASQQLFDPTRISTYKLNSIHGLSQITHRYSEVNMSNGISTQKIIVYNRVK